MQLVRCHDRPDCKTDEQITKFFMNKFIMIVYNQIRFDTRYFDKSSIIPETRIMWVPVNTQIRQTTPFKISTTQLILQDTIINLDDMTALTDDTIFSLEQKPLMPYEKDLITQMDITVEMNLNNIVISRDGYTFLDWLADIGGM